MSFSIGILVSTSILAGAYYSTDRELSQEQSTSNHELELSEEKATEYLTERGFMVIDSNEYDELKEEIEQQQALLEEQQEVINQNSSEEELDTQTEKDNDQEQTAIYTLEITDGMSSRDIALELEEANVISDASEFSQYLGENDYSRSIQIGSYVLTSEMSYHQIAITIAN